MATAVVRRRPTKRVRRSADPASRSLLSPLYEQNRQEGDGTLVRVTSATGPLRE